jgi:hypothetical protein
MLQKTDQTDPETDGHLPTGGRFSSAPRRLFFFVATGLVLTTASCNEGRLSVQDTGAKSVESSSSGQGNTLRLGEETPEKAETNLIAKIVAVTLELQKKNEKKGGTIRQRDVHSKAHGCVRAVFEVDPKLPAELTTGVFQPGGMRYPAWVRISNGAPGPNSDTERQTSRGLAIKLLEVPGQKLLNERTNARSQDLLLVNGRRFFIKDLTTYLSFLSASNNGNTRAVLSLISLNPFKWKDGELAALIERTRLKIGNPVEVPWFSAVPYKFRDTATKYRLDRCDGANDSSIPDGAGPDYLREAMKATLSNETVCYDFSLILQKDPVKQPIENSLVEWPSEGSDRIRVGKLIIPPQDFTKPETEALCENMSFNPWHSLPEHRPLGSMNRARKAVYIAASASRREENGLAPHTEATPDAEHTRIMQLPSAWR